MPHRHSKSKKKNKKKPHPIGKNSDTSASTAKTTGSSFADFAGRPDNPPERSDHESDSEEDCVEGEIVGDQPDRLHYGTLVCIEGLLKSPEFNGKWGQIQGYVREKDRYLVKIEKTLPILSLKKDNFSPVKVGPTAKFKYLEVWPVDSKMIKKKSQIPVSKVNGGVPPLQDSEVMEIEFLKNPQRFLKDSKRTPWERPKGLKAYTKDSTYPDIYFYFDAADKESPRNDFACSLSPYPEDIGYSNTDNIRGSIVVVRQQPPLGFSGSMFTQMKFFDSDMDQAEVDLIGIDELQDSLWHFYHNENCNKNAKKRDVSRLLGDIPDDMLRQMAAMGGTFHHVKFP